jgi:hypothetical protein
MQGLIGVDAGVESFSIITTDTTAGADVCCFLSMLMPESRRYKSFALLLRFHRGRSPNGEIRGVIGAILGIYENLPYWTTLSLF